MGKYENIKTASELVKEVWAHGLSTEQDDLNRAADIFGNSTIEELAALANDIGRNNADGEPDPKGSFSTGRNPTRDTFYFIASHIWNWEDVTRFWNLYTNPDHEKLTELRAVQDDLKNDISRLKNQLEISKAEVEAEHKTRLAETTSKLKAQKEIDRLGSELHFKDMEIMELKAKLYDLMVKEEDK